MENFSYSLSTAVHFGKDQIKELRSIIAVYGDRILLVYGGGSIKRMGLYDEIKQALNGCEIHEVSGVLPNPRIDSVYTGVNLCKEHAIEVVLAVGGGSVVDCAKTIAAGACYEGDAWDLVTLQAPVEKALPLCAILTLAAAGSEISGGAVISHPEFREKRGFDSVHLIPKAAILDPVYTFSVPAGQTAAGSIDIFSHLLEQYFTDGSTYLADQLCEGVMKTVIHYAPIALEHPTDYEARAQLMWARSLANNGILSLGSQIHAFSCHGIEHEISAFYDIVHGVGLAIVTPQWMRYVLNETTVDKFARYGTSVWAIDPSLDPYQIAEQAIAATEHFFEGLGVPLTLGELGIDATHFEEMVAQAVPFGYLEYAWVPLQKDDVVNILKMCL